MNHRATSARPHADGIAHDGEARHSIVVTRATFFDHGLQPLDLAVLNYLWFLPPGSAPSHAELVAAFQRLGWRSANGHPIGRDAVYAALGRLIHAGYVGRHQHRRADGQLGRVVFDVHEHPLGTGHPAPDVPARHEPAPHPVCGEPASGEAAYGPAGCGEPASPQVGAAAANAGDGAAPPTPPTTGRENPPPYPPRRRRARQERGVGAARIVGVAEGATPDQMAAAADVLAGLVEHRDDLHLGTDEVDGLAGLAARWLARGAGVGQLTAALTTGLPARIDRPAGFVRDRLTRKMPHPRRPRPASRTDVPAWCGTCDPAGATNLSARYREQPDGTVMACPRCHPSRGVSADPVRHAA